MKSEVATATKIISDEYVFLIVELQGAEFLSELLQTHASTLYPSV